MDSEGANQTEARTRWSANAKCDYEAKVGDDTLSGVLDGREMTRNVASNSHLTIGIWQDE